MGRRGLHFEERQSCDLGLEDAEEAEAELQQLLRDRASVDVGVEVHADEVLRYAECEVVGRRGVCEVGDRLGRGGCVLRRGHRRGVRSRSRRGFGVVECEACREVDSVEGEVELVFGGCSAAVPDFDGEAVLERRLLEAELDLLELGVLVDGEELRPCA